MSGSGFILTYNDIQPNKFALKFDPPIIALEYKVKSQNIFYLLQINISEQLKEFQKPEAISKWIFNTYSDVFNSKIISEKQVINLIHRVNLMKKMNLSIKKNENKLSNNNQDRVIETRTKEEKQFYKSNHNFFKSIEDIGAEDESNKDLFVSDDYIKSQIEESNKMSKNLKNTNRYNEENKKFDQDTEFKMENLSQYLNKPSNTSSSYLNNVDDISLASINSDKEDKF